MLFRNPPSLFALFFLLCPFCSPLNLISVEVNSTNVNIINPLLPNQLHAVTKVTLSDKMGIKDLLKALKQINPQIIFLS